MRHRIARSAPLAVPLLLAISAASFAAPPTSEQVTKAVQEFRKAYSAAAGDEQKIAAAAKEAVKDLSIPEMSVDQLREAQGPLMSAGLADPAIARLTELAKPETSEGAQAAAEMLSFMDSEKTTAAAQADAISKALARPGLKAALASGKCEGLMWNIGYASPDALRLCRADIDRLNTLLTPDLAPRTLRGGTAVLGALLALGPEEAERAEQFRTRLVEIHTQAADRIQSSLDFFNGAYARGQLINQPAPALTVTWSSDPAIKSIADLKGKVVVLDFWATWCGPCVASFPKVRDLVTRYQGYPVAVVGVTSLQGRHIGPDGKIDTKDDPQKEYGLMPEFIARKNITWPVVFTSQDVFNTDFGVNGIPHVAILDAEGKVRFNRLHPGQDFEDKCEKIDSLLKEAGVASPKG